MIRVRKNFWIVLVLLGASITLAVIWGAPIYYRMIYLLVGIIVLSWVWTSLSLRQLQFKREARTLRHQVGQIFEERFEVVNKGRLSKLFISVYDLSRLPGANGSKVLTRIAGKQTRSYISYTWLTHRGLFELGPTLLEVGDLLGIFSARLKIKEQFSLLVTPYLVQLHDLAIPSGLLPGGRALHIKSMDPTPYAAGVREYVTGDPLRKIHWPSTARRDQLMVKEFEQDPQAEVWIIIDADRTVQAELPEEPQQLYRNRLWLWMNRPAEVTIAPSTMDYAVSVAGSMALYFVQKDLAVGLICSGSVYTHLQPEKGERQLVKIFETLAFVQGQGTLPLHAVIASTAGRFKRGSILVIITPSTDPQVIVSVDELGQRHLSTICALIDPQSFGGAAGMKELSRNLVDRDVPVFWVTNGCNLQEALEIPLN